MKFGPERRVRKRPEFLAIQSGGRRFSSSHFVWIVAPGPDPAAPSRLGITASKRVGNSVRRSRLKRIVRAAFQEEQGMLPAGHDLVVLCKKDDPELGTARVVQEWRSVEKRFKKWLAR